MSNQKVFTRSHVSARIRSFSAARLYLMTAYLAPTSSGFHLMKLWNGFDAACSLVMDSADEVRLKRLDAV